MTRWRKTVALKHLLSDDDSPEHARKIAGQVAAILKAQREYRVATAHNYEFSDIADQFDDLASSSDGTCEDFNALLAEFYDWADDERVWVS